MLPCRAIHTKGSFQNTIFKAPLDFAWLGRGQLPRLAPAAQLILYPQYPEVRLSGVLRGCAQAPSTLLAGRSEGRVLFLGPTASGRVLAYLAGPETAIAREFASIQKPARGVLAEIPATDAPDTTRALCSALAAVHRKGWIDSKQLKSDGEIAPCIAPQCGGFTLEAELGIPKNSETEPDYMGWEIKQHHVPTLDGHGFGGAITLITPEPSLGYYALEGVEAFVRKYGYPDQRGRSDRMNFGGIFRFGQRNTRTGLTLHMRGYEPLSGKISDASGGLAICSDNGEVAAAWPFESMLRHWSRKHDKAAYVRSARRDEPRRQYAYGARVRLAKGTDPLLFLRAVASGAIYYDPGIKLEMASGSGRTKRRSQFRIASAAIQCLYNTVETVDVTSYS